MNIDCMMMNKNFKMLSAIVALSLLAGCNSEGAFSESEGETSSNQASATAETIMSIEVTPSPVNVVKGLTKQMVATATFSDTTSSDVSDSVTWQDFDTATATVSSTGVLTGVEIGSTILTAMMDGVTSNEVNVEVEVCEDLTEECIDIFDAGSGQLFINSPSMAYLDSIGGGSATSPNTNGSVDEFYRFNLSNAKTLCDTYNTNSISGRTNWRLPTSDELTDLFDNNRTALETNGWANLSSFYWSGTTNLVGQNLGVVFISGSFLPLVDSSTIYTSCVSDA